MMSLVTKGPQNVQGVMCHTVIFACEGVCLPIYRTIASQRGLDYAPLQLRV